MLDRPTLLRLVLTFATVLAVSFGVLDILSRMFTGEPIIGATSEEIALADTTIPPAALPIAPDRLVIPTLGVDAYVEHVGVNPRGHMKVPSSYGSVAWYEPGFRPGEVGNAVIAGHLDNSLGIPAVFFNLKDLRAGDEVLVVSALGETLRFIVRDSMSIPYEGAPTEYVFGEQGKPQLVLITCDGDWDKEKKSYKNRLVIFAELSE